MIARILLPPAIVIGAALTCSAVMAADLRGTYVPSPADPAPTWTGYYIGGHVGYGAFADDVTTRNIVTDGAGTVSRHDDGVVGGGQVGYDVQVGNSDVVLGLEGDVTAGSILAKGPLGLTTSRTQDFESNSDKVDLLATVRGRLGYTFGQTLLYGTGGLAIRHGEQVRTQYFTPTFNQPFTSTPLYVDKATTTDIGYAVGAGLEYAFAQHWSIQAEYNYLHFEGITANFPHGLRVVEDANTFQARRYTANEDLHLAKVGVNYRF